MLLPRIIALAVDKVAQKNIGKDWSLYSALLERWREIVGEEYAKVTTPAKITFPNSRIPGENWNQAQKKDGVLHVRLPQGLAMEFSFLANQIIQRINSFFGHNAITRIVFEPYYSPPAMVTKPSIDTTQKQPVKLTEATKDIENHELRQALEEFGFIIGVETNSTNSG